MRTAKQILTAKKCGDIFSEPDKAVVEREYKEYARRFHPDVCADPDATDVFAKVNLLRDEALNMIDAGRWTASDTLIIRDERGKTYRAKYLKSYQFELGTAYIADLSVTYLLDAKNKNFFDNAVKMISSLKYANKGMEDEISRYMPKIKYQFKTADGRYCLILSKTPDVFMLSDVLDFYKGAIPDRHVAWIISRLCNICCYFDYLGIAHNGLTIQNCFISPQYHTILPLGGWWYARKDGEKLLGVPRAVYEVMPVKAKGDRVASGRTDLESAKLIGRQIADKSKTPKQVLDFLSSGTSTAIGEFQKWSKALDEAYGERRFVEMNVSRADIYKK